MLSGAVTRGVLAAFVCRVPPVNGCSEGCLVVLFGMGGVGRHREQLQWSMEQRNPDTRPPSWRTCRSRQPLLSSGKLRAVNSAREARDTIYGSVWHAAVRHRSYGT